MVATKQKSTVESQKIKGRESKHTTMKTISSQRKAAKEEEAKVPQNK